MEHGDGSTVTRCVAFSGASLTGEQVLARSGVEYKTVPFGGLSDAVCQVDGEPATFPPSCWTGSSPFWELFVTRKGGAWSWSSQGISTLVFHDGDSEGLRYEPQTATLPPAAMGNCPSATPTPRPTPKPTPLPTPRPTTTPLPTAKPGSTPGAGETPAASPTLTTGTAASSASAAATFGAPIGGLASSPTPIGSAGAAASTGGPGGADGNGSSALPVAVVAIVGLAGLAALRRRPSASGRPR